MLPAPSSTYCSLLRPRRAIEEVGRRLLALTLSAPGGYLEASWSLLPGLLAASPPLFSWLRRLTGISSVERLHSLASVSWIGGYLPPPPGAGRGGFWGSHGSYPGFMLGFPIRSQACCFAQSHRVNCSWNKYVKFGLFSYAVRVSHLSLVGGVKQPWGGHILQQFQDYMNMKSPSFTP